MQKVLLIIKHPTPLALYFILLQNFFFLTPLQEVESLNEPETNRAFDAQNL